jgi:hypothetical protein
MYARRVTDENEARRRAAAIEALQVQRDATPPARAFWERNGSRIVVGAVLLLAIALVARLVGGFMRSSVSETARATEALRKGLR